MNGIYTTEEYNKTVDKINKLEVEYYIKFMRSPHYVKIPLFVKILE